MIVVDVNVLAYLLLPGKFTGSAERLLERDSVWAVPRLWRSELRNILATYVRAQKLAVRDALEWFQRASDLIDRNEYEIDTATVLRLCEAAGCSAYHAEYVALAEFLGVDLVSADAKHVKAVPERVRLLAA